MLVEFKTIIDGHDCKCLKKAFENTTDKYSRKVDATKDLKIRDFRTKQEKGAEVDESDCDNLCGQRCLSIDVWNDQSVEYIKNKHFTSVSIAPMLKPKNNIAIFKLKEGAGKVKHTPNQKHGFEKFHYDFYKSDTFAIEMVELIEMLPIMPNV